jgi:hypothetical protein
MNNSWLLAMETMAKNYRLKLNYGRYRRLQIMHVLRSHVEGQMGEDSYRKFWQEISHSERAISGIGLVAVTVALKALRGRPRLLFRRAVGSAARWVRGSNEWLPPEEPRSYRNMLEVFEGVAAAEAPAGLESNSS